MRFASAISTRPDAASAVSECLDEIRKDLGEAAPSVAFLFLTPHHADDAEEVAASVRDNLETDALLGCTGAGVLAAGREIEDAPGLAILAGSLGHGANVRLFSVGQEDLETSGEPSDWHERAGTAGTAPPSLVLLPDPFSLDAERLLSQVDAAYPASAKVGGCASGGSAAGEHALICGGKILHEGAVGAAILGDIRLHPLVSQGCRPIGERYVITQGEGNVIAKLAGRPALEVIQETLSKLPTKDQALARTGLLIGRVVHEEQAEFHRGDFLIRGLAGADRTNGAVAVGDLVRRGQTVQLQVRDGATADEDLRSLLSHHAPALKEAPPAAALLFACNGRGRGMYGDADHDSRVVREAHPGLPMAGFFCNGEIGPIGGRSFLHGFTSSVGFLTRRS